MNSKSDIPPAIRRFVLTSIPSVPHIEALILLHGTAPQRWSATDLAKRLYVTVTVAEIVLRDLFSSQLLNCDPNDGTYHFDESTNTLGDTIVELADLYRTHLVEITLLIHSKLDRKAQQFADAFNWRKED